MGKNSKEYVIRMRVSPRTSKLIILITEKVWNFWYFNFNCHKGIYLVEYLHMNLDHSTINILCSETFWFPQFHMYNEHTVGKLEWLHLLSKQRNVNTDEVTKGVISNLLYVEIIHPYAHVYWGQMYFLVRKLYRSWYFYIQ